MKYIVFDLEWNNAYNYSLKKGMNEIIEIGAVKLNERFELIDTFKQLIKPTVSRKLGSNFKNLTHITMDEINKNGVSFDEAFADFSRWGSGDDIVYMSWSTSDLYTLVDNYKRFKNTADIAFIKKYADAQSYCMQFIDDHNGKQIGLSRCAEKFEIDVDTSSLHRALEDCVVAAQCVKKVFDDEKFCDYVSVCDTAFFERLVFKSYYLKPADKDKFKADDVMLFCPACDGKIEVLNDYTYNNNTFKNAGVCTSCGRKFWAFVRAKQTYDEVVVSSRLVPINKRRAKYIN